MFRGRSAEGNTRRIRCPRQAPGRGPHPRRGPPGPITFPRRQLTRQAGAALFGRFSVNAMPGVPDQGPWHLRSPPSTVVATPVTTRRAGSARSGPGSAKPPFGAGRLPMENGVPELLREGYHPPGLRRRLSLCGKRADRPVRNPAHIQQNLHSAAQSVALYSSSSPPAARSAQPARLRRISSPKINTFRVSPSRPAAPSPIHSTEESGTTRPTNTSPPPSKAKFTPGELRHSGALNGSSPLKAGPMMSSSANQEPRKWTPRLHLDSGSPPGGIRKDDT